MTPFPMMPTRVTLKSVIPMSKSGYMRRAPELLLSIQPFYQLSRPQQIIITRYWVSKRFALLGRLEKVGMKNIRIKI